MRTTVDLPEEIHRIAMRLAKHGGLTLGQALAELVRRGMDASNQSSAPVFALHPKTRLPVVRSLRTSAIAVDDVLAAQDEE
jgi:hypothetical protein